MSKDPRRIWEHDERNPARLRDLERRLKSVEHTGSSSSLSAPGTHAATHTSTGGDPLAANDIGAASLVDLDNKADRPGSFIITANGVDTVYTVTHNKGTRVIMVQVWEIVGAEEKLINPSIKTINDNDLVVTFASPLVNSQAYRVVII